MVGSIFFFLFIQSQRKFCTIEYTHTLFINSEWPCWPQQKYRIDLANKSSTNHCFWNVPRTHTHEHFWKSSKIKRYFEGPRPEWMNEWRFSLGEIGKKPNQMDKFFFVWSGRFKRKLYFGFTIIILEPTIELID